MQTIILQQRRAFTNPKPRSNHPRYGPRSDPYLRAEIKAIILFFIFLTCYKDNPKWNTVDEDHTDWVFGLF